MGRGSRWAAVDVEQRDALRGVSWRVQNPQPQIPEVENLTVFQRFETELHDYVEVYPAHYAGSVCGKEMSPKTTSTIGFERRFNPALQVSTVGEFTRYLKSNALKPFPEHEKIKAKNSGLTGNRPRPANHPKYSRR